MQWTKPTQQWVKEVLGPGTYLDMARNGDVRLVRVVQSIHDLITSALHDGIDGSQANANRPVTGAIHALVAHSVDVRKLWQAVMFDENYLAHQRDEREESMTRDASGYGID